MADEKGDLAHQYDASVLEGQDFIRRRWRSFSPLTRRMLADSGFYSERGHRLGCEEQLEVESQTDIERLEHALGTLSQCAKSQLPMRTDKGAPIPAEAWNGEVLTACEELLVVHEWHDCEFLRLGVAACCKHQLAKSLAELSPPLGVLPRAVFSLLGVFAVLLLPGALAWGLVSAARGELAETVFALYLAAVGLIALVSGERRQDKKHQPKDEVEYRYWSELASTGVGAVGRAHRLALERMLTEGIRVPDVAVDLCVALESAMLSRASREATGQA